LDDVPVRDADVLRGHAVRAEYLAAGAVDVATEFGDVGLLDAVKRQWANTLSSRTHLTGGVGSHHQNEEFGSDFELPADRAYAETCAAIGSVMLSWRLLLQTGEVKYADLIERTLLNAVLVSPREDGKAFYYSNTLHQRTLGSAPAENELSERAEASLRAPWFEVSCCPTNVARTLASVASYFATATTAGVQIHQFGDLDIATAVNGSPVRVHVRTSGYPFDGHVSVTVDAQDEIELSIRVPSWAADAYASIGGEKLTVHDGYVRYRHVFDPNEPLLLDLPMTPRLTYPDARIDALRGTAAVECGPLVLCVESTDLPGGSQVDAVRLNGVVAPTKTAVGASVSVAVVTTQGAGWPYNATRSTDAASETVVELRPYFQWANRGPSTMRVFIPLAAE
jgi:DUF1680 family protein